MIEEEPEEDEEEEAEKEEKKNCCMRRIDKLRECCSGMTERSLAMRSRVCLMEAVTDLQPVSWRLVAITPAQRYFRIAWVYYAREIPQTAPRMVTQWDRSFFWLVQKTMLEHIAIRLAWVQVDCDAIEFALRVLIAITVFKRRNTVRDDDGRGDEVG